MIIRNAETDTEIRRVFPVMRQLRHRLVEEEFVPTIRKQQAGGYRLAYLEDEGEVRAAGGYRVMDNLYAGRVLYVDDLVTDANGRSKGYGAQLLSWLTDRAREEGCSSLELDSGVQRFDAHRFYLTRRMFISSHHFRLELK